MSTSSSNGLSIKSDAPSCIAWTASATSACPVITITGTRRPRAFSCRRNSMPSTPGMRTSVTMQPSISFGCAARNAVADSCRRTAKSAVARRKPSDLRTSTSSSTTCTTSLATGNLFLFYSAQREPKRGATARWRLCPDMTTVGLDDSATNGQADTHSVLLGGDERLEELGRNLWRQSRAGIDDANLHHTIVPHLGCDTQFPTRRTVHGLHGVSHQVQQYLLNLDSVGQYKL